MAVLASLPWPANLPPEGAPVHEGAVLRGPVLGTRADLPLGQILLEDGGVDPADLLKATVIGQRQGLRVGQVLLAQGMVTPAALVKALSRQWRTTVIDPRQSPPDPRLIGAAGAGFCLTHGILPWRRIGGVTWIATARPEDLQKCLPRLPGEFGQVRMLLCTEEQAEAGVLRPPNKTF